MLPFVTPWVDLKGIMPGEVTETDKHCVSSLNVQNLKKLTSGKQSSRRLGRTGWGADRVQLGVTSRVTTRGCTGVERWFPGAGVGGLGRCWSKGTDFQLEEERTSAGERLYSMVITANNTLLCP